VPREPDRPPDLSTVLTSGGANEFLVHEFVETKVP
jgi:hypothetical protein